MLWLWVEEGTAIMCQDSTPDILGVVRWKVYVSHDLPWTIQYTITVIVYWISTCLHVTHIRLPWIFKVVSDMLYEYHRTIHWQCPPLSQDYLEHSRLFLTWSFSSPGSKKSEIMLPWRHPRKPQGWSQDSNGKTWLLLTCGGSHVSQGRLQVVQRPLCDDKAESRARA